LASDPLYVEEEVPIRDEIAHLAGIRSITCHTTAIVTGSLPAHSYASYYLEYDERGTRIRHEKFNCDKKLVRRWLYDVRGNLSQEITYDSRGDIDYWFEVMGNGQGWTEKRMYSRPNHLQYRIAAERNGSGRLRRTTYYDSNAQAMRADSYSYDSMGLLVRVEVGGMGECLYEYDQRQNLKRKSKILPGMSEYGEVYEFTYDDRDLVVRMEHLHFSVTTFVFTST
jgi:hypothetical protein